MIGIVLKHRYEIIEKIAEDNLFTICKCEDKINSVTCVAKILLPQYASNKMFAERLLVEAQALVGVAHPGLVQVLDTGEESGNYFVITEYVKGVDLKERVSKSNPVTLSTAVDVGIAISDVVDFAHRRGFVHGDLRPGKILVTPEGQIKIADFWVGSAVASSQVVRTSALMRSIHYMSPEIAEGKAATPASDIYSIGVILYELLTGSVPFDGDTPIAVALKHAKEPIPSARALNPGVTKSLEALIVRALQKSSDERFRSAKAMLVELRVIRESLSLSKPLVWSQVEEKKKSPDPLPDKYATPDVYEETQPAVLLLVKKVLIGLAIAIAIIAVIAGTMVMTMPQDVRLPDLTGLTLDDARAHLAKYKIDLVVRSEQYNEEYKEGIIYFMNPEAGRTIKSGKTVTVWVSKGSKYATCPNVTKLVLEDARQKIIDAGLTIGQVTEEYSSTVPAGNVTSQKPGPDKKLDRGSAIDIAYSLGPKPEEIPSADSDDTSSSSTNASSQVSRKFDVKFTVPPGAKDQTVEIRVEDANGENTAYVDIKHPGDKISETVEGVGDKVTIKTYIDDKLVNTVEKTVTGGSAR